MKAAITQLLFFLFLTGYARGQELNARVQLLSPNVSNIEKRNLDALQKTIADFLNNNKWTNENYTPSERIVCNFVITITDWDGNNAYKANAQILSSRPVYGTSYQTTLLNISDSDFDFGFAEGQSLDFSDQNFISNLSSLLGFYAYTIIGLDKDSFAKYGGSFYHEKASKVVINAQNGGYKGWKAFDGLRNRYWLNENLVNNKFEDLRAFIYDYHLNGLDKLQDNQNRAVKSILASLSGLKQMDKQKLGSVFPNSYFASKADEIVNIFSISVVSPSDQKEAYDLLKQIDPANISKYESLNASSPGAPDSVKSNN